MNNTALRAEAQSANNIHMVLVNNEHKKFYYEQLKQMRYQDCYYKALIDIRGILKNTRNHFNQIYVKSRYIKTRVQRQSKIGFHQCWQTIGSIRVISFLLALIRTEHQVLTIIRAGTIR